MIVNFEKDKIIFNVNNSNYFEYMEKDKMDMELRTIRYILLSYTLKENHKK
jgi:hypothetical protein